MSDEEPIEEEPEGLPAWIENLDTQRWVMESFSEMTSRQEFLDKVTNGTSEFNAGIEVGWTPAKIRRVMNEPEFRELVVFARDVADGNIEKTLHDLAREKGNMAAIQMWLFNRRPDRWKDVKRIEHTIDSTVRVDVVHSTKAAALALLDERTVAELQQLAIETTATDDDDL